MNGRLAFAVMVSLFVASLAWAGSNLNLSKSNLNVYRMTYSSDLASPAQVDAILVELDKLGPVDEAELKQWLAANLKLHGIADDQVKKLIVLPPSKKMKEIGIILLTKPEDEAAAIAVTVKSSKSHSSD